MKKEYAAIALIIIASLGAFANTLNNKFLYDDADFITENPSVKSPSNIPSFFVSVKSFSKGGNFYIYRPLSTVTYALEYSLAKLNPVIFHLSSILWHAAVCVMLYFTLSLILGDKSASLFSALLFAVHPVQAETVAWVSQRSNLISLFFFLLALYLWIKESRAPSVACYALALLGKEMAITLPVILILYDGYFRRKDDPDSVRIKGTSYLPFFGTAVLYVILRTAAMGRISGQDEWVGGTIYTAMLTGFKAAVFYMRLLIFPVGLSVDHGFMPAVSFSEGGVAVSCLLVLSVLALAVLSYRRHKEASFFMLWFFVTLIPVSNFVPMQAVILSERFLYFPSIGFCVILAMMMVRLSKKEAFFLAALLVGIYGCLTISRNAVWKNGLTLWTATLKEKPDSYRAHNNLGVAYIDFKSYAEAIECFERAISIDPAYAEAYYNLGRCYFDMGRYAEAIRSFSKAITINPAYTDAYNNMGVAYVKLGLYEEAVKYYKKAIALDPDYKGVYGNLGWAYNRLGNRDSETESFKHAILANPDSADAYYNLGVNYVETRKYAEAVDAFKQALRINPNDTEALSNLGVAYAGLAKYTDAIESFKEALRINPDDVGARCNMGAAYVEIGNKELALEQYRILTELDKNLAARLLERINK